MRNWHKFLIVFVILLAACSPQAEVIPSPTPSPVTPTDIPTEAPTALPIERPTLPPTWTPEPDITETPVPSTTSDVPPTVAQVQAILPTEIPGCENFGVDLTRTKRSYVTGEDVAVFWRLIAGAEFYKVMLLNDQAEEIFVDYVNADGYIFTADHFEAGKLYGWQVHPISPLGVQVCLTQGAELAPEF